MKKNFLCNNIESGISNIIFDLGGVIINVDYNKTKTAFKQLGIPDFEKIFSQIQQSKIVDKLEVGHISTIEFREHLHKLIKNPNISDAKIDAAWNAMILDFPTNRLEILEKLRAKYKIFLLSNTNQIHIDYCVANLDFELIKSKFEKVYLSHEIHLRKPDVEIYDYVIANAQLQATKTLFIDDTIKNVEGARRAGLNAYHLEADETINDLFANIK
jgi:putative hydrolase of the HAD superfamily